MPFMLPALAFFAAVAAYKYTFRRLLSKADIEGLRTDLNVFLQDELSEEERSIVKKTYVTSKCKCNYLRWIVGLHDAEAADEPLLVAQHQAVASYVIECQIRFAEMYGFVLVQRNKTGKFNGCLLLLPPYPSWVLFRAHYKRAVLTAGRPVPFKMGGTCKTRYSAFLDRTYEKRLRFVGDVPDNWMILNITVEEESQNQGNGANMFKAAKELIKTQEEKRSKDQNVPMRPMYVECDDPLVRFFTKVGFDVPHRYPIKEKRSKDTRKEPYPYNAMVYQFERDAEAAKS